MNPGAEVKYAHAFERERPAHDVWDEFSYRHPKMKPVQRAKIFAPFDALRGFDLRLESVIERCRADGVMDGAEDSSDSWNENREGEAD